MKRTKRRIILTFLLLLIAPVIFFTYFLYMSKASAVKANIVVDTGYLMSTFPNRWKALAQGGEEMGVRMLENVIPQVAELYPRSIRIDHIYDFYDVVRRSSSGDLVFSWDKLDATVCDIYHTGAKPFFVLGYMPPALSADGSLISEPKDWNEWVMLVRKTIERYSGASTRLCGQVAGSWMTDIYYEVWNEPDLETFGKWSLYGGKKDYKLMYFYSSLAASQAQNVNRFFLGGPVTTAAYKNWFQRFLEYVTLNNLRLDFLSWHHYSKNTDDFVSDTKNLDEWLAPEQYAKYRSLPRIISEWGYDSDPNPIADTNVGAAHTIMSIRNFIEEKFEMAFLFEIKDGPSPRWGVLTNDGEKKPRYHALRLFNLLDGKRLKVGGEGTFVRALASKADETITLILVNYDEKNKNTESVPVTFDGLANGAYSLTINYLEGNTVSIDNIDVTNHQFQRQILMVPNTVIALQLRKK